MTWKKDLNKLKQALDKDETPPAKAAPPPKARPTEGGPRSIEEEDRMFLAAMGVRAKPQPRATKNHPVSRIPDGDAEKPAPEAAPAPVPLPPPPPAPSAAGEFSAAMGDLKGLKPMRPAPVRAAAPAAPAPTAVPPPAPAAAAPEPAPEAAPEPAKEEPAAPTAAEEVPARPSGPPQARIHLAAGMAVVVDGSLDLKGHGRSDAEERLKERLLDGYALGWRTLHVRVGSSPELSQMVLDLLASPAGHCVARYAQAPVPMGGAQAWILYFRSQSSSEN